MFKKSFALTAAALVAGVMAFSGTGTASAAHRMFIPPMGGGMGPMHQHVMSGRMGVFHRGGDDWWRHQHHDHDRNFVFLGLGYPYGGYGYDDYYYPSYSYGYAGNAHERWCLAHYRTYDPASDTYIGTDGYRHYCRSYY